MQALFFFIQSILSIKPILINFNVCLLYIGPTVQMYIEEEKLEGQIISHADSLADQLPQGTELCAILYHNECCRGWDNI